MKTSNQLRQRPVWVFAACAALAAAGTATPLQGQVVQQAVQVSAITPFTQMMEFGPVLDVLPYVLSDGYTINLTLIPSVIEFAGYDPQPNLGAVSTVASVQLVPTALPHFTVRQVLTTVNIWDNQTVVLGGLISSKITNTKSKLPVVADLPLVGKLFQSQSRDAVKKNLMIFVTATVVDPAGNRLHSDDELPFAQNTIPMQEPGVAVKSGTASAAKPR
jgi:type II secretory pathway component GspD/PulD (secretin)